MRDIDCIDDIELLLSYLEDVSIISQEYRTKYFMLITEKELKPSELCNILDNLWDLYNASVLEKKFKLAEPFHNASFYNCGLSAASLFASCGYTEKAKDIVNNILKSNPSEDILKSIDNLRRFFEL